MLESGFNLAAVHEAIAAAHPDRECIVHGDRRLSWGQVTERTRRFANFLRARGLGLRAPRERLRGWESGQDHVAMFAYNGVEFLEGMLGAYKARAAPFNVNYRYTADELRYVLADAGARAIVYHSSLAPVLDGARDRLPELDVLVQIPDDSGAALLPGARWYEDALAEASPDRPDVDWSPDDLYILYTGGTTGEPKGVLWRQHDIFIAALGGRDRRGNTAESVDAVVERARAGGQRLLPTPPMMHGAAVWGAFVAFHSGGTVVLQDVVRRLDPRDVLTVAERERVTAMLIVGDAFGQPLLDEMARGDYDLSALSILTTGGAPMNASVKRRLLERLPGAMIVDSVGSSESGSQGINVSTRESGASSGVFAPRPGTRIVSADRSRVLEPGDREIGWLAQTGHVPLGYLGDRERTEAAFPVIAGERHVVPGDRARWTDGGHIELLGRDAVTINSGGEKIFAEEVEHALKAHPEVYDAIVCGRPSERWGQEVCAIVQLRPGATAAEDSLLDACAAHLARYKLPKAFVFVDAIVRHPNGKADYKWAAALVGGRP